MARPLRKWPSLLFRPTPPGVGRRLPARASVTAAATTGGAVEALEPRQLFAASLVSFDTTGTTSGNGDSIDADMTPNGRWVVFASTANNLDPLDTNSTSDIYLRDLQTGVTKLLTVNSIGNGSANGASTDPSVSDDGRYVVFTSLASNLTTGDSNGVSDVYLRDVFTNTTTLISKNGIITGTTVIAANAASLQATVSGNGKFVVFASDATDLTNNDATGTRDVYVRSLVDNTTTLVSRNLSNTAANGPSQEPYISKHGQFIAFTSDATDLTGLAPGPGHNVYLFDSDFNVDAPPPSDPTQPIHIPAPTTSLVSTNGNPGSGGLADLGTGGPVVDESGLFVAFSSSATDLVGNDTNGVTDVFRKDVVGGEVQRISISSTGVIGNGASIHPSISDDGSRVAFSSVSTNLHPQDGDAGSDVFLRDAIASTTTLASVNRTRDAGTNSSVEPSVNADASIVAFSSASRNLVNEPTTNTNVFVATPLLPLNDDVAPAARVPGQPNALKAGEGLLQFTVVYNDAGGVIDTATLGNNDLIVTGPNGFNQPASLFAVTSTNGNEATVVYTVPATDGQLSAALNGTYTVVVRGGQVADAKRNFVPAGTAGTFDVSIPSSETVLPQPTFSGGSPEVGAQTYDFSVIYSERGGINFATFGNDDVQVTGPNGFSQAATFLSSTPLSITTTAVTYRITAPGGTWDATDSGTYDVSILPGGVTDVAGNAVAAGVFGQFSALGPDLVAIPLRNLRSAAISGVDVQRARIRVLNLGSSSSTVPVAITLFTSADKTLDAGDATIGTFVQEKSIAPDQFQDLRVTFTYPQVQAGGYYVIAQVDSANAVIEQNEGNNVAASLKQVGLSSPFVDLVPTLLPFTGNRSRLGENDVTIKIRNNGNVQATGDITVALTAISDVTPEPAERPITTIGMHIDIRPGQTKTFKLPFTFPIEFERGTYKLVVNVDSANVIPERDDVNNRVVAFSSFSYA
jgi:Tol biopolymer transport system component